MGKLKVLLACDNGVVLHPLTTRLKANYSDNVIFETDPNAIDKNSLILSWSKYDSIIYVKNIDEADIDLYIGHPHLRCFDFNEKLEAEIIDELENAINNIELEKKYLIKMPSIDELSVYKPFKSEIEQIYLLSDNGSHRIRKRGIAPNYAYFETLKLRITGDKCYEYESIIDEEKYNELKQNAKPKKSPIIKDRYCFLYMNKYFELDIFPFWDDKALIELELSNEDEAFELPPEIEVIKDVSNDSEYKNNHLASVIFNENSKTDIL